MATLDRGGGVSYPADCCTLPVQASIMVPKPARLPGSKKRPAQARALEIAAIAADEAVTVGASTDQAAWMLDACLPFGP